MFVIDTGFESVKAVALGPRGEVAALRDGEWQDSAHEDDPAFGRWAAKVWATPMDEPRLVRDDEGVPFGLALDPVDGIPLHGNEWHGLVMADERICRPGEESNCGDTSAFAVRPDGRGFVLGCEFAQAKGATYPDRLVQFGRVGGEHTTWNQDVMSEGTGFTFSHLAFLPGSERFVAVEWSKRKDRRNGGYERGKVATLSVYVAGSLVRLASVRITNPVGEIVVCGEQLVISGANSFRVWSAADLSAKSVEVKTGRGPLTAVAADVHGCCLFTAAGNTVTRWDVISWKPTDTYDWKAGAITCLAVAPDGLTAAAGTATGKVVVWDVE